MSYRRSVFGAVVGALCVVLAACGSDSVTANAGMGDVVVQLTDAPFSTDSVKSVDIFVTRVDARTDAADSAAADSDVENGTSGGWQTIATPNASINLLALQHGTASTLGSTALAAGTYSGLRLIIDPTKSSVTLKNGVTLTARALRAYRSPARRIPVSRSISRSR
jgi:hypothetical protein